MSRSFRGRCGRYGNHALFGCAASLFAPIALAAPHDDAANALVRGAMYGDYLETHFAESAKKLEGALAMCQLQTDCRPAVRARILCDLGVVEFVLQRQDEGRAHFARAVQEDPGVIVEPDFATPDLVRELIAVKNALPASTPPPADPATSDAPGPVPAKTAAPSSDCPPDFPGCSPAVASCTSDDECPQGKKCSDGACGASEAVDDAAARPYKRNWLSLAVQEDILLLPGARNACAGGTGYACFSTSSGTYYAASPFPNADDLVNAGTKLATTRILAGFDRAVSKNFLLGVRLGYVLGGGPTRPGASSFLPVHAEARVVYWFGVNPLARAGFRFYAVLAGGLGEVDASQPVDLYSSADDAKKQQNQMHETAWRKTGNGFAAFGGGAMFAIAPSTGIVLEVKVAEMFPTTGTGFDAQLGYMIGF